MANILGNTGDRKKSIKNTIDYIFCLNLFLKKDFFFVKNSSEQNSPNLPHYRIGFVSTTNRN